jgi:peptide/nickel transport system permease protein
MSVEARLAATQLHKSRPVWRRGVLGMLLTQKLAMTGAVIVVIFSIIAIIGPFFAPHGETEQFSAFRLKGPSSDFLFGNDEFGRDIFSRLIYGSRISFQVGVIAVGISAAIGILIGIVAGYIGGWVDGVLSLLMDVLYAFPTILLAIAIMAMLGNSLTNVMIAIGVVNAPTFMRVVRGSVLSVRHMTYVEAAHSLGASVPRIMAKHVMPNIIAEFCLRCTGRGFASLPRTGESTALTILGIDGLEFVWIPATRPLGRNFPGSRHRPHRPWLQPRRRRPPRRPRPAPPQRELTNYTPNNPAIDTCFLSIIDAR